MILLFLFFIQFLGFPLGMDAQPHPYYPKGYFRNPLDVPMDLSANFGELRPDHWHMGLDIRTAGHENEPVHAAADGYIARVGIRPQSYGRFIVINHPNGFSTLYGHLNNFFPELEKYVTEQQYKQESWAVELSFTKDQFPVSKGNFIAYSGNTGGSLGAHLHFEIIDTKTEKRLNPLLFGFPIKDNTPPTITRLAMYNRSISVYEQSPIFFPVKKKDSSYIIPKTPLIKTGLNKMSFALQMYDKMNEGGSQDGVFSAQLYVDNELQIGFMLDSIDYVETGYVNAQIDYKLDYNGGGYVQHLSQLPGHKGVEYYQIKNDGVLSFSDTAIHKIRIDVKDAYGNLSQLNFGIQYSENQVVQNLPGTDQKFIPCQVNILEKPGFKVYMPEKCLYDTVPILFSNTTSVSNNAVSESFSIGNSSYPVHVPMEISIKQNKEIPEDQKNKLVIVREDRRGKQIKKAGWENEWIMAKFGDFGAFQAFTDLTPPSINDLGKGDTINLSFSSGIVFTPTDNSGIKKFRAELDNNWIRFTNDKSKNWIYNFDEHCPYGLHHLKVIAEDIVGNVTTKEWWFKRLPYTPPPVKKKIVKKPDIKKKQEGNKLKTKTKK